MKQTIIEVEGKPFCYNDESDDITYASISAISESEARLLLDTTQKLFSKIKLDFFLAFGTLLGAVRDKTLIKGDEDVDVFIEDENSLRRNLPFLSDNGYKVCRIEDGRLYSFRINGSKAYIDVYIRRRLPLSVWSLWCTCLCNNAVPRKFLNKKAKISFLGSVYSIPAKPERILEFWYGKDWRTPIRGHNFTYDTPSRYWWKQKGKIKFEIYKYYFKLPFKFVLGWKYWKHLVKKQ